MVPLVNTEQVLRWWKSISWCVPNIPVVPLLLISQWWYFSYLFADVMVLLLSPCEADDEPFPSCWFIAFICNTQVPLCNQKFIIMLEHSARLRPSIKVNSLIVYISLGYYLDEWTGPCTWPSGWLHLDKWLSCTSKVYQISIFSEWHLHKWHMPALSQVISQTVY